MSRFCGDLTQHLLSKSASFLGRTPWHVGCSCLCVGCFYVADVEREDVNLPPEIVQPSGPPGTEHPFELLLDGINFARVIAVDPEGGPLDIFWLVPGDPNPSEDLTPDDDRWLGQLYLERDPAYDGLLIEATVVDDAQNSVDVLFRVEVP